MRCQEGSYRYQRLIQHCSRLLTQGPAHPFSIFFPSMTIEQILTRFDKYVSKNNVVEFSVFSLCKCHFMPSSHPVCTQPYANVSQLFGNPMFRNQVQGKPCSWVSLGFLSLRTLRIASLGTSASRRISLPYSWKPGMDKYMSGDRFFLGTLSLRNVMLARLGNLASRPSSIKTILRNLVFGRVVWEPGSEGPQSWKSLSTSLFW